MAPGTHRGGGAWPGPPNTEGLREPPARLPAPTAGPGGEIPCLSFPVLTPLPRSPRTARGCPGSPGPHPRTSRTHPVIPGAHHGTPCIIPGPSELISVNVSLSGLPPRAPLVPAGSPRAARALRPEVIPVPVPVPYPRGPAGPGPGRNARSRNAQSRPGRCGSARRPFVWAPGHVVPPGPAGWLRRGVGGRAGGTGRTGTDGEPMGPE